MDPAIELITKKKKKKDSGLRNRAFKDILDPWTAAQWY